MVHTNLHKPKRVALISASLFLLAIGVLPAPAYAATATSADAASPVKHRTQLVDTDGLTPVNSSGTSTAGLASTAGPPKSLTLRLARYSSKKMRTKKCQSPASRKL